MKLSNRACVQQSKLSLTLRANTSRFCPQPLLPNVTVFQNNSSAKCAVATHIIFVYVNPQRLRACSFPKYPARTFSTFTSWLVWMKRLPVWKNLVINFAPSIITGLIVFALQGHISKLASSKWMVWHSHCKECLLKTDMPSSANCQDNTENISSIKWFWHGRGWVLYSGHVLNWGQCILWLHWATA